MHMGSCIHIHILLCSVQLRTFCYGCATNHVCRYTMTFHTSVSLMIRNWSLSLTRNVNLPVFPFSYNTWLPLFVQVTMLILKKHNHIDIDATRHKTQFLYHNDIISIFTTFAKKRMLSRRMVWFEYSYHICICNKYQYPKHVKYKQTVQPIDL